MYYIILRGAGYSNLQNGVLRAIPASALKDDDDDDEDDYGDSHDDERSGTRYNVCPFRD